MSKEFYCPHCKKEINPASLMGKKGGTSKSEKKLAAVRENAKKGGRKKIAYETKFFELNWDRYPAMPQKVAVDIFPEGTSDRTLYRHKGNLCARSIDEAISVLYDIDTKFVNKRKPYKLGRPDRIILLEK